MYSLVPAIQNLKARRAHVKELRKREDELKTSYQNMKAIDDLYNKPQSQTRRTHAEQNIYADKTRELGASTSEAVEIERRPILNIRR
ncbi:324d32b2-db71-4fa1-bb9e-216ee74820f3 [Sclerotinia trifoliorum]|uniref:324d32b2-db71-4fa1-bb9e-216ee74820f3 n=1 Tax=Sclerotinia trifoliorum TaxID=28548 RepID=A0A8H2VXY4_9HELO|nr:324d32b2-db71-4fa1-bb9e-216ee74820f3 [Sclerotinia trifoliorum]